MITFKSNIINKNPSGNITRNKIIGSITKKNVIGNINDVYISPIAAPIYSPEATALFARMNVQPSTALKQLIDKTITDLKTAGIWDKTDKFHKWDLHTPQASLLDWKNPAHDATNVNNSYLIGGYGLITFPSTNYLDLNFIPTEDCENASLNNMAFSIDDLASMHVVAANFGAYNKAGNSLLAFRTMEVGVRRPWLYLNTTSQKVWNKISVPDILYYNERQDSFGVRIYKDGEGLGTYGSATSRGMIDNDLILGGHRSANGNVNLYGIATSTLWLGKSFTTEQRVAWYEIMNYWKANAASLMPAYLGNEIVTNEDDRTFNSDTGWWEKGASWTIGGGVATSDATGTYLYSPYIFEEGKTYQVSFEVVSGTLSSLAWGASGYIFQNYIPGTYKQVYKSTGTIRLAISGIGSIRNISVKEFIT